MSTRPLVKPTNVFGTGNSPSMATNLTSNPTIINELAGVSYDLTWTGTPTGTFQIQVSNTYLINPDGSVNNPGSWTTIPSTSFQGTYPVPSGSASNGFIDVVGTEAYAVRLTYTAASGTGNLTAIVAAKVL